MLPAALVSVTAGQGPHVCQRVMLLSIFPEDAKSFYAEELHILLAMICTSVRTAVTIICTALHLAGEGYM
jgi:hypothetical protein